MAGVCWPQSSFRNYSGMCFVVARHVKTDFPAELLLSLVTNLV